MGNWKKTGEVSDSEEDFDFDDDLINGTQHLSEPTNDADRVPREFPGQINSADEIDELQLDDVWDLPKTPSQRQHYPRRPPATVHDVDDQDDDSSSLSSVSSSQFQDFHPTHAEDAPQEMQYSPVVTSSAPSLPPLDEISTTVIRNPGSSADLTPKDHRVVVELPAVRQEEFITIETNDAAPETQPDDQTRGEWQTQRAGVRAGMGLRDRKTLARPFQDDIDEKFVIFARHGLNFYDYMTDEERKRFKRQQGKQGQNTQEDSQEDSQEDPQGASQEDSQEREYEEDSQEFAEAEAEDLSPPRRQETKEIETDLMSSQSNPATPVFQRPPMSSDPFEDVTDNTSPLDDDLPSLSQLASEAASMKRQKHKRHIAPHLLPSSKRRKIQQRISRPTPSSRNHAKQPVSSPIDGSPIPNFGGRRESPSTSSRFVPPPGVRPEEHDLVRVDESSDTGGTESESNVVRQASKRIRGVLPASWLRIDQKGSRDKAKKAVQYRRMPGLSPEKEPRRGLAQRGVAHGKSTARSTLDDLAGLLSSSDDEEPVTRQLSQSKAPEELVQTALAIEVESGDSDGSSMEDNGIDHMISSKPKQGTWLDNFRKQKHTKTHAKNPRPPSSAVLKRQERPRTSVSKPARKKSKKLPKVSSRVDSRRQNYARYYQPPPRLGILDVIEPDAPSFLRIAARTARRQRHMGRSSPTSKIINLADRRDNIDAASTLHLWRQGSIRPRSSVTEKEKSFTLDSRGRAPLRDLSGNIGGSRLRLHESPKQSKAKSTKKVNLSGKIRSQPRVAAPLSRHSTWGNLGDHANGRLAGHQERPAQLEADATEITEAVPFREGKRLLDAIFKRSRRRGSHTEEEFTLPDTPEVFDGDRDSPELDARSTTVFHQRKSTKRPRKQAKPLRVDTQAAQFVHSNDPIVVEDEPILQTPSEVEECQRLQGLGKFGTHYTQHFETFPIDHGLFFHETTIIGSCILEKIAELKLSTPWQNEHCHRTSLAIDEKVLSWSDWSEQTASELGILTDWILERLQFPDPDREDSSAADPIKALEFILDYILKSLRLPDPDSQRSFVNRTTEVLQRLRDRLISVAAQHSATSLLQWLAGLRTRALMISLATLQISRTCHHLFTETLAVEDLVKQWAKDSSAALLKLGTAEVRSALQTNRSVSRRERGIQASELAINYWAVLVRSLDIANMARFNFWDAVFSGMEGKIETSQDSRLFERLWQDMFSLLPLCELDNTGVFRPGRRFKSPMEGWSLPQRILKRVFVIYKANSRQPPTFNEYCRALVGRCLYLVQEWDWRKCGGILGVIFDFFGSQNLSHLRNEEVFKSPSFLEELPSNPSLKMEKEDRCFHIFLKIIATVLRRLRHVGTTNDIRNIVARTLPNHSRQFLKEQTVHERELASLRNHHDLLCTLFWVTPKEMRPSATMIEKLVPPVNSHKEACLINLRAWSQISRLVVAENDRKEFGALASWQKNVFQQILSQYDSAASDIQQQLLAAPKDISSSIDNSMVVAMISMNKSAALDVLHFSVKASLDVIRQSRTLESALFSLNVWQLNQVWNRFSRDPPEFDWAILESSLNAMQHFLDMVDSFEPSSTLDGQQLADTIIVLEHGIAGGFFSMARCILANSEHGGLSAAETVARSECVEKAVVIAARLTCHFIRERMMQPFQILDGQRLSLFETQARKPTLVEQRYLPLFVSSLMNGFHGPARDLGNANIGALDACTREAERVPGV